MGQSADEIRVCYEWGFVGWALVWAALSSGKSMWLGLAWLASRTDELYFWMACATGAASFCVQYVVSTVLFLDVHDNPPSCTTNLRSAPDLTVWLLYHFWTLAFVHERFVQLEWSWWTAARRLVIGIVVPVVLVVTENSRWEYVAIGAALGVAMGALSSVLLVLLWYPRMEVVAEYTRWAGAMHWPDLRRTHHLLPDGCSEARVFY